MDLKDTNGVEIIKNLIFIAKRGNGSAYFVFANSAHNNKQELKLAYIKKVDDNWWLGSGTYLSNLSANFSQESRNNLTNFVESAIKYAKNNGKDKVLKEFNDKNGAFFKEGLYVFVVDFTGNNLALPTRPDLIGKNRIDIKDPNGVELNRDMIALAQNGGEFIYYIYPDPARNMMPGLKLAMSRRWTIPGGLAQGSTPR